MEWKTVKLGDICTIKGRIGFRGYTTEDFVESPENGAITLSPSNIIDGEIDTEKCKYVTWAKYDESPEIMVKVNDIVLGKTAAIGRTALIRRVDHPMTINPQLVLLSDVSEDVEYISYYLKSQDFQGALSSITVGSVVPTLSQKNLAKLELHLPSLDTQHRIAAILSSLDAQIDNNNRINRNLEEQAQALFKSWFVDFEPWGGVMPEAWKEGTLNDLCIKITDGSHFSPKDDTSSMIPMLSVKDMLKYGFDYTDCKHISESDFINMKKNDCVPLSGDILIAKDGSYLKEIFMCHKEEKQAILSSIAIFRPNLNVVSSEFLLYLLKSKKILKDVRDNYVSGSAVPRIVLKDFKRFPLFIPSIDAIASFTEAVVPINMAINNYCLENVRLATLRDTLLPKLMKEEIKL